MPKHRTLLLDATQRADLVALRAHAAKPDLRERAAALLKIADGARPAHVARHGLLRPHAPDTIDAWLDRYHAAGLAGLQIRPGRGRPPAFFPSARRRERRPDRAAPSGRA